MPLRETWLQHEAKVLGEVIENSSAPQATSGGKTPCLHSCKGPKHSVHVTSSDAPCHACPGAVSGRLHALRQFCLCGRSCSVIRG